jgi:hypothetical protein
MYIVLNSEIVILIVGDDRFCQFHQCKMIRSRNSFVGGMVTQVFLLSLADNIIGSTGANSSQLARITAHLAYAKFSGPFLFWARKL